MGTGTTDGRGPEIWIRGPVAAPPEPEPYARGGASPGPRPFSWVATHGGAGTTTLARVFGGRDCGRGWPGPADPACVLLVARTHAGGLTALFDTLEVFRLGQAPAGLDLAGVVLVADAPGRLPRPLALRVRAIGSAVDVYRVPWVTEWRLGDLSGAPPRATQPLSHLTGAASRRPR